MFIISKFAGSFIMYVIRGVKMLVYRQVRCWNVNMTYVVLLSRPAMEPADRSVVAYGHILP